MFTRASAVTRVSAVDRVGLPNFAKEALLSRRLIALVLAAMAVSAGVAVLATLAIADDPPTAQREALAAANNPAGAKGRTLGLSRVVVPSGAQLALHHHAGTQTAYVDRGVLTYTVKAGSVTVRQGPADGKSKVVRTIGAGQTGPIKAGQWIVEQPTTIHQAANRGSAAVVIYLASLFPIGAPPSIPESS
jgi:mannose-6-phosphate isomerase-like protein (cupin superfamily)